MKKMFRLIKVSFRAYVSPMRAHYNSLDENLDRIEEAIADSPIRETTIISTFDDLEDAKKEFENYKEKIKTTIYNRKINSYIGEILTLEEKTGFFPDEIDRFINIKL